MYSERNPGLLLPITIQPIMGVSTVREDFTYGDLISANSEKWYLYQLLAAALSAERTPPPIEPLKQRRKLRRGQSHYSHR